MTRNVKQLSRNEMNELKYNWCSLNDIALSWGEVLYIDDLISDELMFKVYEKTEFSEDDLFCSCIEVAKKGGDYCNELF